MFPFSFALTTLPLLNSILNSISAVLLISGYVAIRRRRESVHKACMLAACVTSGLFLISYLTYHYHVGSKPFTGHGGTTNTTLARPLVEVRIGFIINMSAKASAIAHCARHKFYKGKSHAARSTMAAHPDASTIILIASIHLGPRMAMGAGRTR